MGQSKRTYMEVHSDDALNQSGEEQIFDMQSFAQQLFFNPLHTNNNLLNTLKKLNQNDEGNIRCDSRRSMRTDERK
jgi:hypothetical protein